MADAKLQNLAKIQARLRRVPVVAQDALRRQLKTEADDLVGAIKGAMEAQYDQTSNDHESLINSLHAYENPDRAISYRILADAKDAEGEYIGSHVEAGHKARDGSHVAPRAAFYPTYRARKSAMKRRLAKAAKDAIKNAYGGS